MNSRQNRTKLILEIRQLLSSIRFYYPYDQYGLKYFVEFNPLDCNLTSAIKFLMNENEIDFSEGK